MKPKRKVNEKPRPLEIKPEGFEDSVVLYVDCDDFVHSAREGKNECRSTYPYDTALKIHDYLTRYLAWAEAQNK